MTYTMWRKKFVEVLLCQQFGVDIESNSYQPLYSFPWPYFFNRIVYISSRKVQKSFYVNTVCGN
jgi:hypothetical protein